MNSSVIRSSWVRGCVLAGAAWLFTLSFDLPSGSSAGAAEPIAGENAAVPEESGDDARVSLAVARERAALAHVIYATTMDIIHHHYFRKGQAILPARAMEEVFTEVAEQSKVEGRWIAVNTKAMSIHHEPRTSFEKQAASAIAAGREKFERVEKGYFRSARAIPLGEGCVSCHEGMFRGPANSPRYAGLVISIPIK
ncbi:MAG: DUF3365 domain-containing protein [Limisphaerales bacterium]